jgi:hypothetical protein
VRASGLDCGFCEDVVTPEIEEMARMKSKKGLPSEGVERRGQKDAGGCLSGLCR